MATLGNNVFKLLQAINFQYDEKLLYNSTQFYSVKQQRPVTVYTIKKTVIKSSNYSESVEIFSTTSRVQVVLFLRDYLFRISGAETPRDNPEWEQIKKDYIEKHPDKKEWFSC